MARRQRYQRGALRQEPIDLSPSSMSAGIQARGAVTSALGEMAEFLNKKAQEQAIQRGTQMVQNLGAQQTLAQIAQTGGPSNIEQKQAFAVASKFAAGEIETEARKEISRLILDSEQKNISLNEFGERLNPLVEGFSQAMKDADPEQAMILQQDLNAISQVAYTNYASFQQTKLNEELKGRMIEGLAIREQDISVTIGSNIPVEQKREAFIAKKQNLREYLINHGASPEDIAKTMISIDKQSIRDATFYEFSQLKTDEERLEYIKDLDGTAIPGSSLLDPNDDGMLGAGLTIEETRDLQRKLMADYNSRKSKKESNIQAINDGLSEAEKLATFNGISNPQIFEKLELDISQVEDNDKRMRLEEKLENTKILAGVLESTKTLTPVELDETMNDIRNNGLSGVGGAGVDKGIEVDVFKALETKKTNLISQLDKDPLNIAHSLGLVELKPLDVAAPPAQQKIAIQQRIADANTVKIHYGLADLNLLTSAEMDAINQYFEGDAPISEQLQTMAFLNDSFGKNTQSLFKQLNKKHPEMAHIGGLYANGSYEAARHALIGKKLVGQDYTLTTEMTPENIQDALESSKNINLAFALVPGQKTRIIQTAEYIYISQHDRKATKKGFDDDEFIKAINMAAGMDENGRGGIAEIRGVDTILPFGQYAMNQDEFESFLENPKNYDIFVDKYKNVDLDIAKKLFLIDEPFGGYRVDISLHSIGNNKYQLMTGKADSLIPLEGKRGGEVIIDLSDFR